MASDNPPAGYELDSGASDWGVEINKESTTTLIGGASLKWDSGATTSERLWGPWFPVQESNAAGFTLLRVWSRQYVSAGTNGIQIAVAYYQADLVTSVSTDIVYDGAPNATGSWIIYGSISEVPANAKWARIRFTPKGTTTGDVYVDETWPVEINGYIDSNWSSPTTTVSGSWQTVNTTGNVTVQSGGFRTGTVNLQSTADVDNSVITNGAVILYEPGIYHIEGRVRIAEVADGDIYIARLQFWDTSSTSTGNIPGPAMSFSAAYTATGTEPIIIPVSVIEPFGVDGVTGNVRWWYVNLGIIQVAGTTFPSVVRGEITAKLMQ